jgi:protein phosphatase PTC7
MTSSVETFTGVCGVPKSASSPIIGQPTPDDKCGHDSYCIAENDTGVVLGIADGVGSWAEDGIDAGLFSRTLMRNVGEIAKENASEFIFDLKSLLKKAFSKLVEDSKLLTKEYKPIGSSTACIASIDKATRSLRFANFGDSSMFIVSKDNAKPGFLKVSYKTNTQQHSFNFPYQLTLNHDGSSQFEDKDVDCNTNPILLNSGDVVFLVTDGVLDNLFFDDVLKITQSILGCESVKKLSQAAKAKRLADEIAIQAKRYAASLGRDSPYALEVQKRGWSRVGGKMDDITVLVTLID